MIYLLNFVIIYLLIFIGKCIINNFSMIITIFSYTVIPRASDFSTNVYERMKFVKIIILHHKIKKKKKLIINNAQLLEKNSSVNQLKYNKKINQIKIQIMTNFLFYLLIFFLIFNKL